MQGLIDTHFHLDMYRDYQKLYKYIDTEKQYTLCMTNSPGVFLSCKKMFQTSKYIEFALGFHPLNADLKKRDIELFINLLPQTDYVGEVGLDFTNKIGLDKDRQIEYFDTIVKVSSNLNKLMSIHIRGAEQEALQIIERYSPTRIILHWYTGSDKLQKKFIELGCYFSVNANMLRNMHIINNIPLSRLLIESDGPYSKVNNKKFKPQLLFDEYEMIAMALNERDLVKIVYDNFKTLLMK